MIFLVLFIRSNETNTLFDIFNLNILQTGITKLNPINADNILITNQNAGCPIEGLSSGPANEHKYGK